MWRLSVCHMINSICLQPRTQAFQYFSVLLQEKSGSLDVIRRGLGCTCVSTPSCPCKDAHGISTTVLVATILVLTLQSHEIMPTLSSPVCRSPRLSFSPCEIAHEFPKTLSYKTFTLLCTQLLSGAYEHCVADRWSILVVYSRFVK